MQTVPGAFVFGHRYFDMLWMCLILGILVIGTDLRAQSQQTHDNVESTATRSGMLLKVRNEQGAPIAGANVHLGIWTDDEDYRKRAKRDYVTNENGEAEIEIGPQLNILRIWVSSKGFVSLFVHWEQGQIQTIPATYTATLQPATRLGGIVVDSSGKPVVGVRVEVKLEKGGAKADQNENSANNSWLSNGKDAVTSNKDGTWQINNAPPGEDLELEFMLTHANYLADERWQGFGYYRTNLKELRDGTARFALVAGHPLTGRVVDPAGRPVSNALVVVGDRPYLERGSQECLTDADGKFRIPPQPSGDRRVTVVASGWSPQSQMVDFGPEMKEMNCALTKGKRLHLNLVDSSGRPVQARVSIDSWRDSNALYNIRHPNVLPSGIPDRTNENGEYIWEWAPTDALQLTIGVKEWGLRKTIEIVADDSVQTITLSSNGFNGKVFDAKTGEPITGFTVVPVTYSSVDANARGIAQSSWAKQFDSHEFKMNDVFSESDWKQIAFRVLKPGYEILTTPRLSITDNVPSMEFKLTPVATASGRIVSIDGKPVQKARAWIVLPDDAFFGSQDGDENGLELKINEGGGFEYATPVSNYAIIAATKDGYAEQYLRNDETKVELKLEPWSRIEGQVYQAGRPVPDVLVMAGPIRKLGGQNPHVQDGLQSKTGADGRFVFDRVPPEPCVVRAYLGPWEDSPLTSALTVPLKLTPGQTNKVDLGGNGLRVTGKVVLEGKGADRIEMRYAINYLINVHGTVETPIHARNNPIEWQSGKQREYEARLVANLDPAISRESHFVKLNPDGTFLINGVRPGDYRFLLKLYEPPTGCLVDPVGYGYLEFSTKDFQVSNNSIDLGQVKIQLEPIAVVGDILPDFSYRNVDGSPAQISQRRGKKVVIDFWATWCKPCVDGLPDLKVLNRELKEKGEFELISISLDEKLEAVAEFLQNQEIDWQSGVLGKADGGASIEGLGVSSVPLWVVLDVDGKILFRTHSLSELKQQLKLDEAN
jgi:thiol-disulfide isomerase/thioredoxin